MPTTVRETLLAAAAAKLAAITGISGLVVKRNWRDPVAAPPMIIMRDGSSRVMMRLTGADQVAIGFDAECYAQGADGQAAAQALNTLYGAVAAAVLGDHTLGGSALDVRELELGDPLLDVTDGALAIASQVVRFEIVAMIKPDDPYTLAP